MIRPETNIPFIESIANHPTVVPFIRLDGERMDFSELEGKRYGEIGGVVLSNGEDAVAIFEITAPGIYQSHTLFGPTCRGRKAIDTAKEMVAWMFDHGARIVWGATPKYNRKALLFNRMIGAKVVREGEDSIIFEIARAA